MEFITMIHPDQKDSAELKRQAHSHAARVAHARARRQRTSRYRQPEAAVYRLPTVRKTIPDNDNDRATRQQNLALFIRDEITLVLPKMVSGSFQHEPLASFLGSLTSREHFLFNYYTQVVAPDMQLNCPMINHIGEFEDHVRRNWILFGSTDWDFLNWSLLAACRHLSMVRLQEEYTAIAAQYKLRYIQSLRKAISDNDQSSNCTAVTRALVLAMDDIMIRDMPMASNHLLGAIDIVKSSGGTKALGLSDVVRCVLYSCVHGKRLLDWNTTLD